MYFYSCEGNSRSILRNCHASDRRVYRLLHRMPITRHADLCVTSLTSTAIVNYRGRTSVTLVSCGSAPAIASRLHPVDVDASSARTTPMKHASGQVFAMNCVFTHTSILQRSLLAHTAPHSWCPALFH